MDFFAPAVPPPELFAAALAVPPAPKAPDFAAGAVAPLPLPVVADGINRVRATGETGVLLITHYTRILRYVSPDFVHVFVGGRIVEEGGPELAQRLEKEGYAAWGAEDEKEAA